MTRLHYQLVEESRASQYAAGRYHPATVIHWQFRRRKYRAALSCGSTDEVDAFRSSDDIIVVSRNTSMGYCGAERFPLFAPRGKTDGKRVTVLADPHYVFFQSAAEFLSEHCRAWEDCTLRHLARVLADWLY